MEPVKKKKEAKEEERGRRRVYAVKDTFEMGFIERTSLGKVHLQISDLLIIFRCFSDTFILRLLLLCLLSVERNLLPALLCQSLLEDLPVESIHSETKVKTSW